MAVQRVFVPDPDPEPGNPLGWYDVTGSNGADTYTTQVDDRNVYMRGGEDTVYIRDSYYPPTEIASYLQVFGGDGNDRLLDRNGYSGEAFWGNAGNDYMEAGSGDEGCLADGGVGNDVLKSLGGEAVYLRGGVGSDKLYASADDSGGILNGGGGKDRLFCDAAQDTLAFFTNHSGVGAARDVVYRFDEDADLVDLAGMDADRGVGGNQEFGWYGEVDGPSEVAVGGVGYYRSGEDLIVAGNNGIRFEIELDGLAGHAVNTDDFML